MLWTNPKYADLVEQWRQPADPGTEILTGHPDSADGARQGRGFVMEPHED